MKVHIGDATPEERPLRTAKAGDHKGDEEVGKGVDVVDDGHTGGAQIACV